MTTVFDPQTFAQRTFTDANSTESFPIPVGEWSFTITKATIDSWKSRDLTKAGLKCILMMETADLAVIAWTGRPRSSLRHEIMLDLTEEGNLDFGKGMNVNLGRAREACGINRPGAPFAFDMFVGHPVKATVKHEEYEGRLIAKCAGIVGA
jgi:hypothetical protein